MESVVDLLCGYLSSSWEWDVKIEVVICHNTHTLDADTAHHFAFKQIKYASAYNKSQCDGTLYALM